MSTGEIFSRTSFRLEMMNGRLGDSSPGTSYSEDGTNNMSSPSYSGSHRSDNVLDSPFYAASLSSEQPSPCQMDHLFSKFQSSMHPWKMEQAGVSGLSYGEATSLEEQTNDVRQKLIESGQMDRLKELVHRRLSESGWKLEMMGWCRAFVRKKKSKITFDELFEEIRQAGKDRVPECVQNEVLKQIKFCYESAIPSED